MAFGITSGNFLEDSGTASFTVFRTHSGLPETVLVTTIPNWFGPGLYPNNSDYSGFTDFAVTFGSFETSKSFTFQITPDPTFEDNETFGLIVENINNVFLTSTTFTILNDDAAPTAGSVSISNATISEGNSGTKMATFTVTRTGGTAAFNVNFATSDGTATVADGDYIPTVGFLGFGTGVNTQTFSVTINGDTKFETDEAFFVNLSGATNGATISNSLGIGTILNDDAAPTAGSVSISDAVISEGDSGTKVATFTVTRTGGTAAFNIDFVTSDGGATAADGDYNSIVGFLGFGTGINTQTISVTINGDTKFEADETFFVNLSGASSGAIISDSQGMGTILNDDAAPAAGSVSISDAIISEGDSGTKVATFTVTRTGGTAAFNIDFVTSDGGATAADGDYNSIVGFLGFGTGINTQTISVTINGDTKFEADETFFVNLSGASSGAIISDSQGMGTILNDDTAPAAGSVSISDAIISEGDSGTKVATFTVTRTGGTAAFNVNFATSDGSATTADGDYNSVGDFLGFGAGVNTKTISVTINGDTKIEPNVDFFVNLSGATNGAIISHSQGKGTITNDDASPPSSDYQALLVGGNSWSGVGTSNRPAFVTYSFESSAPGYLATEGGENQAFISSFRPLSSDPGGEQDRARSALSQWDSVSGIHFLEVPSGQADIRFGAYNMDLSTLHSASGGYTADFPDVQVSSTSAILTNISGDILLRSTQTDLPTILHEIGHAIGLHHPNDNGDDLGFDRSMTVMSYNGLETSSLGPLDTAAASFVYGTTDGGHLLAWSWDPASLMLTQIDGAVGHFILGVSVRDTIYGGGGNDRIVGFAGNDELWGGTGRDTITGGSEADDFNFKTLSETGKTSSTRDIITDFQHGDDIDLHLIDAKSGGGNQGFKFIGAQHFHHVKGELHYVKLAGAHVIVAGDVNGDGRADFQIDVHGVSSLARGDFIL